MLDTIGWLATAIFSASYFFRGAATLRRLQAAAACLWIAYGLAIHALPVVIANLIVAIAAAATSAGPARTAAPQSGSSEPPAAGRAA
jgi:hypothetical protein